jgi:hypothetical protein
MGRFYIPMLYETKFNNNRRISVNLRKSAVKNLSIKTTKICETNPISEMPKMVVTLVKTTNYNEQ